MELREYPEPLFGESRIETDARYANELAERLRDESLLEPERFEITKTLCDVLARLRRTIK